MKMLSPVNRHDIPGSRGGRLSPYESIYQKALTLDGRVLPVEFETTVLAMNFKSQFTGGGGRGFKLGLCAERRGNTVYVYKDEA